MGKQRKSAPKRWYKKDVTLMCGLLDEFVLVHTFYHSRAVVVGRIEEDRQGVVLGGLEGRINMAQDRLKGDEETVNNALENPGVWGDSTDEIVERFRNLAAEEITAINRYKDLQDRIKEEGLPEEVKKHSLGPSYTKPTCFG